MGNRITLILFVSINSFINVLPQKEHKITGVILDSLSNPIPYTSTAIKETSTGTVSNEKGEFSIRVKDAKNSILVVSILGFKAREISLKNKKSLEIILEPESLSLNKVIVRGNSTSTQIEQKGFTATSIPLKELQSQSVELNQVLNQNAGIRVREQGGLGSRVNYSINGLEGNAVRFFLDGIPMDYFGSSYSASIIPILQINRIDIYKGVVPVELGSDALGVAINLISKKDIKNSLSLNYSFGSFNTHKASIYAYGRTKQVPRKMPINF